LLELSKARDVEYLLVVVASATEQEYPLTIFLEWHTHSQPGLRRDNWSLLEAALIDVKTGTVLLRGEGRSMATLDRPTVPGINQWYPVIWLRPSGPDGRPWWPPTYEGAPNTLRVVAMNDAEKRLALDLQRTWLEFRHNDHGTPLCSERNFAAHAQAKPRDQARYGPIQSVIGRSRIS
jgi:hypothetical protein